LGGEVHACRSSVGEVSGAGAGFRGLVGPFPQPLSRGRGALFLCLLVGSGKPWRLTPPSPPAFDRSRGRESERYSGLMRSDRVSGLLSSRTRCGYLRPSW
jgi:hypothetical protein